MASEGVAMLSRGEWHEPMGPMWFCPGGMKEPEPCDDCGFVGEWEWRPLVMWHDLPGHRRSERIIMRDVKWGLPPRRDGEGWYVWSGREERCPGCGDVEQFDTDGELIGVELSRKGRIKRAAALRKRAEALEHSAWLSPSTLTEIDAAASCSLPEGSTDQ